MLHTLLFEVKINHFLHNLYGSMIECDIIKGFENNFSISPIIIQVILKNLLEFWYSSLRCIPYIWLSIPKTFDIGQIGIL